MILKLLRCATAVAAVTYTGSAAALMASPTPVPIDSPWAIAGLGAVLAAAAARLLFKRHR